MVPPTQDFSPNSFQLSGLAKPGCHSWLQTTSRHLIFVQQANNFIGSTTESHPRAPTVTCQTNVPATSTFVQMRAALNYFAITWQVFTNGCNNPTLTWQLHSVHPGISLAAERDISATLTTSCLLCAIWQDVKMPSDGNTSWKGRSQNTSSNSNKSTSSPSAPSSLHGHGYVHSSPNSSTSHIHNGFIETIPNTISPMGHYASKPERTYCLKLTVS